MTLLPGPKAVLARLALALLIGAGGGALFAWARLPLPWMLGAMTFCGLAAILNLPVRSSRRIRAPMSAVIGAMLGAQFSVDVVFNALTWWPALLGLAAYLFVAAGLCYWYLMLAARLSPATAYFSAMPGGLLDMVLLGSQYGADERTIALIHSSRIFLVVMFLPTSLLLLTGNQATDYVAAYRPLSELALGDAAWFLFVVLIGGYLGRLLSLPAPLLIGPMLVSMVLHLSGLSYFEVPTLLVIVAQVVLGTTIGCRFVGTSPRFIMRIMLASLGSTLILLVVALIFAYVLQHFIDVPIEGILLAFAPGGLTEMSLVALAMNLEVSFVVLSHILRIGMVILGAGVMARLRLGKP